MINKLNSEIANAVAASHNGVIQIESDDGSKFWIMTEAAVQTRDDVPNGLKELDSGESLEWDATAIKAVGRRRRQGLSKS